MVSKKCYMIVLAAFSIPSLALADFDISPSVLAGKIITNAYTDAGPAPDNNYQPFVSNVRVFDFGFDDLTPPPSTQDPGFHPRPGSGFTSSSQINVGAVSGLSFYDGTGAISFGSAPAGESFLLQYGTRSLTIGSTAPSGTLLLGSPNAADNGEFDRHLQSTLIPPGDGTPVDGLYLFELQVSDPGLGLTASDPTYVLFSVNADDSVDSAKEYLRDTYAPGTNLAPAAAVPEPASLGILALAPIALLRRRRKTLALK